MSHALLHDGEGLHLPEKPGEPLALAENAKSILNALAKAKPAAAKGIYMRSITLSSTMGPGFRVDPLSLTVEA